MNADDYADLARLAEAATPGQWEHDGYAGIDSEESPSWIAHLTTYDPGEGSGNPRWRADAEFIAAANPATILRLIKQAQNYNAEADRHASRVVAMEAENEDLTAERDALAARLAAVESLVAEWERVQKQNRKALGELARGASHLLLDTPGPADFRAALAAPTDTTKEN